MASSDFLEKNLLELVTGMLFMGVYFFCDQSNVDQFVKTVDFGGDGEKSGTFLIITSTL